MLAFIDCSTLLEHVEYDLVLVELEDWKRDYSVEEDLATKQTKKDESVLQNVYCR
jgi:hypothetical protein